MTQTSLYFAGGKGKSEVGDSGVHPGRAGGSWRALNEQMNEFIIQANVCYVIICTKLVNSYCCPVASVGFSERREELEEGYNL